MLQVCAVDFTAYYLLGPLIRGCRDAGWDVEFACADGPHAARLRAEGIPYRALPMSRSVSPARNLLATLRLAASLRARPADVVHTHTPMGGIVGRAAAALAGTRVVVHTFHGLPIVDVARPTAAERAFLALERVLARRTAYFFSQASGDVERAIALGIARRDRITAIGNGVDVDRYRPDPGDRARTRRELGIADDEVVIASVSRIVREKGVLDLADAAMLMRPRARVRILVIGAALPSDRVPVASEVDAHPVTRATHLAWQRLGHREDVDRLLRAADVFVLASHREGLPRSAIEALATGLPVVATDIPACRELVDRTVGALVAARDPAALAAALAALVDDPVERAGMSARARARALERHDERRIVAAQIERIRSLAT